MHTTFKRRECFSNPEKAAKNAPQKKLAKEQLRAECTRSFHSITRVYEILTCTYLRTAEYVGSVFLHIFDATIRRWVIDGSLYNNVAMQISLPASLNGHFDVCICASVYVCMKGEARSVVCMQTVCVYRNTRLYTWLFWQSATIRAISNTAPQRAKKSNLNTYDGQYI